VKTQDRQTSKTTDISPSSNFYFRCFVQLTP